MSKLAIIMALVTGGVVLSAANAPQEGVKRIDLQRHDLSIPGREVIQARIEVAPGFTAPRHKHPGEEMVYLIEGALEYQLDGQPPVTLRPGQVLFIPPGVVHSAKNVGTGVGAELATYTVEKGKPLLVYVK